MLDAGSATAEAKTVNIAAHLPAMAAAQPFAPAIYFPDGRDARGRVRYTHYTYRQLDEASDRIARGLAAHGIAKGTRVALMVKPSLELFSLVFGVFKAGAVPVMIDPGIGLSNMKACLAQGRPEAFIGIPTAQAARLVLGWAKRSVRTVITVGRKGPFGGVTLDEVEAAGAKDAPALVPTSADDMAAILFTSGSTGVPKGAVYTHGNFTAQVEAIRRMYAIVPGEIDLPTFPLFALFDPALGMTTVIPDMDPTRPAKADPKKIVEAIEDFGVTNMFGSPALLNTLGRWGEAHGAKLPSLRRVISAGAPVPTDVLRRVRAMLSDDAQVVTPYGATECLPVATIESREVIGETAAKTDRGAGVCVGRPVPEADVAIVRITDAPIARWSDAEGLEAGEIGEIVVKGPQATRRYFEAEEHTALAKIADDEGPGFRHRMGDLGYLDERGRLWFCGRKSQRVRDGDTTWHTVSCERIYDAHPDVFRSALVGVPRGAGSEPVLCVEIEPHAKGRDARALIEELKERGAAHEPTRAIERFLVHPGFPVDIRHNAKIKREELRVWATKQLGR
jgi:acyl-CoA synthetase (AMP-forming)/AMP-acid ligase II